MRVLLLLWAQPPSHSSPFSCDARAGREGCGRVTPRARGAARGGRSTRRRLSFSRMVFTCAVRLRRGAQREPPERCLWLSFHLTNYLQVLQSRWGPRAAVTKGRRRSTGLSVRVRERVRVHSGPAGVAAAQPALSGPFKHALEFHIANDCLRLLSTCSRCKVNLSGPPPFPVSSEKFFTNSMVSGFS